MLIKASKEFALENALKKMKKDWEAMYFSFVPYKETGVSILSAFDEIQVQCQYLWYDIKQCWLYHISLGQGHFSSLVLSADWSRLGIPKETM